MSLWGHLLVGRYDRPLPELYALRPYRHSVAGNRTRADNWQVCALDRDAGITDGVALLVDIVAETRAPALIGSRAGPRRALVEGFSGAAGYWTACLAGRPAMDRSSDDREHLDMLLRCAEEAAANAVRWAAAAGGPVPRDPVAELLRAPAGRRIEDLFEELLVRLGLAGPADTTPGEIG